MAYKQGKIARNEGKDREENPYAADGTEINDAKRMDWFDGWDDENNKYWNSIRTTRY